MRFSCKLWHCGYDFQCSAIAGEVQRTESSILPMFIDLSKAFDTVNRSTLWKFLLKLGCPERFVGLIRSLHNGMKARVSFNGTLSEEISINNRVKQGDISAPTLFNIYFAIVFLVAFYENSDGIYIRYRTSGSVFDVRRLLSQKKSLLHW